jgi:hypothetical protein
VQRARRLVAVPGAGVEKYLYPCAPSV